MAGMWGKLKGGAKAVGGAIAAGFQRILGAHPEDSPEVRRDTGWVKAPSSIWVDSYRWISAPEPEEGEEEEESPEDQKGLGGTLMVYYYRRTRHNPRPFVAIYEDVSLDLFHGLSAAPSAGKFIHAHIYSLPYREGSLEG